MSIKDTVRGFKTMATSAVTFAAGSLVAFYDQLNAFGVDVKGLLSQKVPVQYVGVAMAFLAVIFGYLRLVTRTPVWQNVPPPPPPPLPPTGLPPFGPQQGRMNVDGNP